MTISFFCTITSESPIGQISNFTCNTPNMYPKTGHSRQIIFLVSEWACSHLHKFDTLNSPPVNVLAYIHIHPRTQLLHADFQKLAYVPLTTVSAAELFFSQYFCPFDFLQWWTGFLFDCPSDCCPSRINRLMSVSGFHFVHPFITAPFIP